MDNKIKTMIIEVVAVLVIVAGVGFWYWSKHRQTPSAPPSPTKATLAPTLGGTISEKIQNPLKGKLPETNPFKSQKNPFDAIYKNPFK